MACCCASSPSKSRGNDRGPDPRASTNMSESPGKRSSQGSAGIGGQIRDSTVERRRSSRELQTLPSNPSLTKNPASVMSRAHDPNIKLEHEYNFEKQNVLGTGFCGSVIMGRNKVTNEHVAIKSLTKNNLASADETQEEVIARVRAECEIYLNCDHPNIVRLRDMYETEETIYLVCDCCTGGELYDRLLKRGQYNERAAAAATRGMLLAVSYIHNTMNIVHRDLKLQNWLYPSPESADDEVKLIDFGFSKVLDPHKKMVVTAGTVEYLAPELLAHQSEITYAGDLWAVGVIVFMLLGGYPPFSGKTNAEIIQAIRKNQIKWYRSRFEKVSDMAKVFVMGLLEKDPAKRFTARKALESSWIKQLDQDSREHPEHLLDGDILNALATFRQKTALEKATAMIMVQCLPRADVAAMEKIFLSLDKTREGSVQLWELKQALQQAFQKNTSLRGVKRLSTSEGDLNETMIQDVFEELDLNGDNHVYFSDFLTAIVSKRLTADNDDALIRATFDRFDVDNSGEISISNLQNLFGPEFRNVKVEDMIKEADLNGDQLISFDEFKSFLKARGDVIKSNTSSPKPLAGIHDLDNMGPEIAVSELPIPTADGMVDGTPRKL
ncbi:unnamed protein product [Amoebophrya sp. A120]|nr:unnamed protein product [Amoebophrya sp. A120]|eukprot:GSA120T00016674001.1